MSRVAIFPLRGTPSPRKHFASLGLAAGLISLGLAFGPSARASTYTWDGTTNDWFTSATHWGSTNPGTFPGSGDDAVNNSAAAMTLGQSTTIQSFFSNGAFSLNGGAFTGSLANAAGTLQVNALFTLNGGQINNFTVQQGTGGSIVVTGSGGNDLINSVVNSSIDMSTNANAFLRVQGTTTVNGAITLATTGNGLNIYTTSDNLVLGTTGSLTGFGNIFESGSGAILTNNGTVNANTSGQTLNQTVSNFVNTGMAKATNGGILSLNNTLTNNGALLADGAGSVVSLVGTLTSGAGNTITATNGGQVQVNGANLLGTINTASGTALIFNGSGNNDLDNTVVNGNLDLSTNANAFLKVQHNTVVNGNITLATTTNGLDIYTTTSNLTLNGTLSGFGTVFEQGSGATLTNNGTVNANTSGKTLNLNITNTNNNTGATLEATGGGILNFNSVTTNNSGKIIASGGGVVNLTGTLNNNSGNTINGVGGTVNVLGTNLLGTINGVGATTLIFSGSGNNDLDNTVVNGNLDLSTNANAFLKVQHNTVVNGNITLATTSNGLNIYSSDSSLTLNGTLSGFGNVFQSGGGATLNNNGIVNANSNGKAITLNISNSNNNTGATLEATNGGILDFNGATTNNNGKIIAASGGVINLTGTLNNNTGNTIDSTGGTVNVLGTHLLGTINGVGATKLIFNSSGANDLDNTTANINLDLSTNADAFLLVQHNTIVNGNITLATTSNGLDIYTSDSSLTLNGTLSGFGNVFQSGGGATLTNNGIVNANVAGQTLNINTTNFTNTGTTEVQNGAFLSVTSANTDSGNVLVSNGGTATFTQGLTQTAGTTQVDGTLNSALTLTGGTLKGTGTVVGNIVNNGGTIAPGDSPGKLSITGAFTQNSGTFSIEFSNTAHDVLAVSGLATTGGILDVNYVGSGASTGVGSIFDILDYGSVATSLTGSQFFSNQGTAGLITGHNGFTYMLINDTINNQLQLKELTAGNPVPETSSVVSLGLLLALGLGGLTVGARRRKAVH